MTAHELKNERIEYEPEQMGEENQFQQQNRQDKDFGKAYQKLINQMLAVDSATAAVFVPEQDLAYVQ